MIGGDDQPVGEIADHAAGKGQRHIGVGARIAGPVALHRRPVAERRLDLLSQVERRRAGIPEGFQLLGRTGFPGFGVGGEQGVDVRLGGVGHGRSLHSENQSAVRRRRERALPLFAVGAERERRAGVGDQGLAAEKAGEAGGAHARGSQA